MLHSGVPSQDRRWGPCLYLFPVLRASSVLMFPPEQEILLNVSLFRGHLQNCFTDRISRKVTESQCLVNQWSDIDISTQTYIYGFTNLHIWFPKCGFGFSTSKLKLSTEFRTLWTMILNNPLSSFMRVKPERTWRKVLTLQMWLGFLSTAMPQIERGFLDTHRVIAMTTSSANSWVFSVH